MPLKRLLAFLFVVMFAACTPLAPEYSVEAYTQATRLKAEALDLMEKATGPFAPQTDRVDTLRRDVNAAYEFSNGLPRNEIVTAQWRRLRDPNGNLLFGFLRRWESTPSGLNSAFVQEARAGVGEAFDTIICVEVNKQTANAC